MLLQQTFSELELEGLRSKKATLHRELYQTLGGVTALYTSSTNFYLKLQDLIEALAYISMCLDLGLKPLDKEFNNPHLKFMED